MITAPTVTNEVKEKVAKYPELQILRLRNTPLSDEKFAMFANNPKQKREMLFTFLTN
jgi:hypothetical protein